MIDELKSKLIKIFELVFSWGVDEDSIIGTQAWGSSISYEYDLYEVFSYTKKHGTVSLVYMNFHPILKEPTFLFYSIVNSKTSSWPISKSQMLAINEIMKDNTPS